jgi:hypothetical protein
MGAKLAVYLEIGKKRTFAGAVDWPGWCRSGRSEAEALDRLIAYGHRYAAILGRSQPVFRAPADVTVLRVVKRLTGDAGTDFGVPSRAVSADDRSINKRERDRFRRLLTRCWSAFDAAAEAAKGVELSKGPRGGGRDLAKIVSHVMEVDQAYLRQLGSKTPRGTGNAEEDVRRLRAAMLDAFGARAEGRSPADPNKVRKPWPPRYFVRRATWHLLDHAWEIEDRA